MVGLGEQDARLATVRDGERGLGAGGAAADYDEVVCRLFGLTTCFQVS